MCVSIYLLLFVSNWIIYESSKTGTGPSHSNWTILHPQLCPMTNHGIVILQVDDTTTGPTYQKPGKTVTPHPFLWCFVRIVTIILDLRKEPKVFV